jgi:signal transduction histidine kinase
MVARSKGLPLRERERLQTIDEQARRATALIRQILDFSRQSMLERQPLDLLSLVKEQVKLLERTLPESIAPRLEYLPGQYTVSADPTRMQQIVMNLAINARDAMPRGGELVFELAHLTVEKGKSPLIPELTPGAWIRLMVRDTGTGIPPEILPHIFDPFFTTKAPGKGSGLGLAQVHGIVVQHEGRIDVATVTDQGTDQGTTITIYLPALAAPPSEPAALPEGEALRGKGERVLLVEDNTALRVAMADMLHGLNYDVLEAGNGQEALALLEQEGANVAVILSDWSCPSSAACRWYTRCAAGGWRYR